MENCTDISIVTHSQRTVTVCHQYTMENCTKSSIDTIVENTVEPLILATLNFGVWVNVIILDPVILAFCFLLHWNATVFKFSRSVIFANFPGSRNLRNKGHANKTGFTVHKTWTRHYYHNVDCYINYNKNIMESYSCISRELSLIKSTAMDLRRVIIHQ